MNKARDLSAPEIAEMIQIYTGTTLPVREIARKFKTSEPRMYAILQKTRTPLRGRAFATKNTNGRTLAGVFFGANKDRYVKGDPEIEAAKTKLRQQGRIVFDATVTDGPRGKGFIKCDRLVLTPKQLIELAQA